MQLASIEFARNVLGLEGANCFWNSTAWHTYANHTAYYKNKKCRGPMVVPFRLVYTM